MFVRAKQVGNYTYLQLVENYRDGGKVRQRVVATLGRLDRLQAQGGVDARLRSRARFAEKVQLQEAYREGSLTVGGGTGGGAAAGVRTAMAGAEAKGEPGGEA